MLRSLLLACLVNCVLALVRQTAHSASVVQVGNLSKIVALRARKSGDPKLSAEINEIQEKLFAKMQERSKLHRNIEDLHKSYAEESSELDTRTASLKETIHTAEAKLKKHLHEEEGDGSINALFLSELHERDLHIEDLFHQLSGVYQEVQSVQEDVGQVQETMGLAVSMMYKNAQNYDDRISQLESASDNSGALAEVQASRQRVQVEELKQLSQSVDQQISSLKHEHETLQHFIEEELEMKRNIIKELSEMEKTIKAESEHILAGGNASSWFR